MDRKRACALLCMLTAACAGQDEAATPLTSASALTRALDCELDQQSPPDCQEGQICPPGPPTCGPGRDTNASIWMRSYKVGAMTYTIVEPDRSPAGSAPVVFHFHGFGGTDASYYQSYLQHLAGHNYVAVFVQYHRPVATALPPYVQLPLPWQPQIDAIAVVKDALNRLDGGVRGDTGHVRPARDANGQLLVAFSGHSLGGIIALRLAAKANLGQVQLPVPQAIVLHDPSTDLWSTSTDPKEPPTATLLSSIATTSHLMVVMEDPNSATWDPKNNYSATAYLGTPARLKNIVRPQSDDRGEPASNDLVSNHFACSWLPANPNAVAPIPKQGDPVNGLDYWACNRVSEAALNAAFGRVADNVGYQPYCDPTIDDCRAESYMGYWVQPGSSERLAVQPMLMGAEALEGI